MPQRVLFCDSFNHYTNPSNKWDTGFHGSIVASANARTGPQCLQIFAGSSGPAKNLGPQQIATDYRKLIQGCAFNCDGFTGNSDILYFTIGAPGVLTQNIRVVANTDGSIALFRGPGDGPDTLLGVSAPGLFKFTGGGVQRWNYIEVKWFGDSVSGFVEVRLAAPGFPMQVILSLTGVDTVAFGAAPITNAVQILAAAGLVFSCFMADYYVKDWSDGSDYLGGVRIWHDMPFADSSPLQFAPSAGANFQNVNSVPPNTSRFNSSGTVGAVDQYLHNLGNTPGGSSILAVQHIMDPLTTSGPRSIASVVNGVTHPNSVFVTNNFSMLYTYQYDVNPQTGLPWKGSDFPASFGPGVTG